ncbi:MAG: tRNA (adenine(22)-N(1))-methyltransferase TrmK [Phycisphaeraceae bacterium]|nr:tRNA (adenine(22)-N(1))-methyltransferase TrmK [Phycisphaeraceae bacterium]
MPTRLGTYNIGGHELTMRVADETFEPNATTDKIAKVVNIPPGAKVLDLGCGVGPLSIYAAKQGASQVIAVDVMPQSCELARENVKLNGVEDKVSVRCGSLFDPVKDEKFDVIINDVSGIAERVARITPWYPKTIPSGGEDGADLVVRVLEEGPTHLMPNGVMYFATSSLSNTPKIIGHAKKLFGEKLEALGATRFPFCKEMSDALDELVRLKDAGLIDYEAKRSRFLWTLEVFRVKPAGI